MATAAKTNGRSKWRDAYFVQVYRLARDGLSEKQVAKAIGVSQPTLARWKAAKPALRAAWSQGRKARAKPSSSKRGESADAPQTFLDYVFQRLSPELQTLWDEIQAVENAPNDIARVEAMLEKKGKRARQNLFVYALTSSNFNMSAALRAVNIPRKTFESWVVNDPGFSALIDEIHWHKKNFFEGAVLALVDEHNPAVVIHCARTQLRDRGYGDRAIPEVPGETIVLDMSQHVVNVGQLDLPLETRRAILTAKRKLRGQP
jgi:transposase